MKEGRKPEYPEKPPGDELQKLHWHAAGTSAQSGLTCLRALTFVVCAVVQKTQSSTVTATDCFQSQQ